VDICSHTPRLRQQTHRHNCYLHKRSTLPHTLGRIGNYCNEKWKMNTADSNNTTGSSFLTTNDDTQIFFKDWGAGQPIVFHRGWPLSSDDWDNQMLFFLARVIVLLPVTAGVTGVRRRPTPETTWTPMRLMSPPSLRISI
jgi:hypothetical protein